MAQTQLPDVLAHWHQPLDGVELPPLEFYAAVEEAVGRRAIPGTRTSRVHLGEGGILSARREYLRVSRGPLRFDLCAAPVGTLYFISSWMVRRTPPLRLLWGIVLLIGLAVAIEVLNFAPLPLLVGLHIGPLGLGLILPVLVVFELAGVSLAARSGLDGPEGAVLAVPLLGGLYVRVFRPETYFARDTEMMFHSAVHAAAMEALNALRTSKGLRALTADEEKPILRGFM